MIILMYGAVWKSCYILKNSFEFKLEALVTSFAMAQPLPLQIFMSYKLRTVETDSGLYLMILSLF